MMNCFCFKIKVTNVVKNYLRNSSIYKRIYSYSHFVSNLKTITYRVLHCAQKSTFKLFKSLRYPIKGCSLKPEIRRVRWFIVYKSILYNYKKQNCEASKTGSCFRSQLVYKFGRYFQKIVAALQAGSQANEKYVYRLYIMLKVNSRL